MSEIDVVIIGGGPGGYVAAIKAAHLGLKALLVEKDKLGGVCLNWGCIPTKALVSTAELLNHLQRAGEFGIQVKDYSFDFPAIMKRKDMITRRLSSGVEQLMKANQVRVIRGEGQIIEPGKVEITATAGEKERIKTITTTGIKVSDNFFFNVRAVLILLATTDKGIAARTASPAIELKERSL